MLVSQLSPPSLTDDSPDIPARPSNDLEQLYWRERQLDAVARAAHIEIAAQQAELTELRARTAEQVAQLQAVQQRLRTCEVDLLVKDRHIRRLRSEMRAVQDYVRTAVHVGR
ncbi:MAG: hypothetical protein KIT87_09065 [Anaerolineae bacterium]|nr:hypothetical protein [Anaerolineae bacterium]